MTQAQDRKKYQVDNGGEGDCMYFAYSISLMYYLRFNKQQRSANGQNIVDVIFQRIGLNAQDQNRLRYLLNKSGPFKRDEIHRIIEPILGPAIRRCTAQQVKETFIRDPKIASFNGAASYGIEYYLKMALWARKNNLYKKINNDFRKRDLTDAEIFKVPFIKYEMDLFAKRNVDTFLADFNRLFELKMASFAQDWPVIWEQKKITFKFKEEEKEAKRALQIEYIREQAFSEAANKLTLLFFQENNYKQLNSYVKHLNTPGLVWGEEENLFILHAFIIGEKKELINSSWENLYEFDFPLEIHKNGVPQSGNTREYYFTLHNSNNIHWTSIIPEEYYHYQKPRPRFLNTLEGANQFSEEALLTRKEFHFQLELLNEKALDFKRRYLVLLEKGDHKKSEEIGHAYHTTKKLYTELKSLGDLYFEHPTAHQYNRFKYTCNRKIKAVQDELAQHRDLFQILGNILLAVLGLVVVYLAAIAINKMFNNRFLFFKTHAEQILNSVSESINQDEFIVGLDTAPSYQ